MLFWARWCAMLGVLIPWFLTQPAFARPQSLVCVENVWCDIAHQIGGPTLQTHVLITATGLDPHHLRPTPSMARTLSQADVVILNGATYDDWALPLISPQTHLIIASRYHHIWQPGEDPHLFFDIDHVRTMASLFAEWLSSQEPDQRELIHQRLSSFLEQTQKIVTYADAIRSRFSGQTVAITEPAGERLLSRLGLHIADARWALATMNESGVSARDTATLEQEIIHHHIRFLLINPTVLSPHITSLQTLAQAHDIPLVELGENLPIGQSWQSWMMQTLHHIESALTPSASKP